MCKAMRFHTNSHHDEVSLDLSTEYTASDINSTIDYNCWCLLRVAGAFPRWPNPVPRAPKPTHDRTITLVVGTFHTCAQSDTRASVWPPTRPSKLVARGEHERGNFLRFLRLAPLTTTRHPRFPAQPFNVAIRWQRFQSNGNLNISLRKLDELYTPAALPSSS